MYGKNRSIKSLQTVASSPNPSLLSEISHSVMQQGDSQNEIMPPYTRVRVCSVQFNGKKELVDSHIFFSAGKYGSQGLDLMRAYGMGMNNTNTSAESNMTAGSKQCSIAIVSRDKDFGYAFKELQEQQRVASWHRMMKSVEADWSSNKDISNHNTIFPPYFSVGVNHNEEVANEAGAHFVPQSDIEQFRKMVEGRFPVSSKKKAKSRNSR